MKYVAGIIIIGIALLALFLAPEKSAPNGESPAPTPPAESPAPTPPPPPPPPPPTTAPAPNETVIIKMVSGAFVPAQIEIKTGQTVTFINEDSLGHWPASAIHPTHQVYPEFDPQKTIEPGESWSFTFDRAGSWRYHDHIFPKVTGIINVK